MKTQPPDLKSLTQWTHQALDNLKGQQIVELDLEGKANFADAMIVASGTSNRHVKALAEEIQTTVKENLGEKPLGVEGTNTAEWILVDYGCLIIHVMLPETRDFYELERLWTARPEEALGPR